MQFLENDEFKKDFKALSKKYRSLNNDFLILEEAIDVSPTGNGTKHWNKLKSDNKGEKCIMKMRMVCRCTRGANFRITYFYDGERVEVLFIEIYFKGKKESEDRKRINKVWGEYGA